MRKIKTALFVLLSFSTFNLFAQINLDKTFVGKQVYTTDVDGEFKYFVNSTATSFSIYNFDHSLFKTINVPQVSGYTSSGYPSFFSSNLFDTDGSYEYFMNYYDDNNYASLGKIYDESGTVLLTLDSTSSISILSTTNGTKMIANAVNNAVSPTTFTGKIYNLPGTLVSNTISMKGASDLKSPYPNPSSSFINLSYSLPVGATGDLTVYNSIGMPIRTYKIGSDFTEIMLNTADYTPGSYTYTVSSSAGTFSGRTFIIQ